MDQGAKRKGGAAVGSSGQSESSWAVPRELGRHDGPIGDTGCTKMALGPEKGTYKVPGKQLFQRPLNLSKWH